MRIPVGVCVAVAAVSFSAAVFGQDSSSPAVEATGGTDASPAAAAAGASDAATSDPAEVLYREAEARYMAGDLSGALRSMEQSYELSHRPELLFNLGQLNRELQHCSAARERYQTYLRLVPDGRRRDDAERAIAELAQQCQPEAVSPPPVATPPAPAPPPERSYWTTRRALGWSAVAAGVVAGGGAVYFTLAAQSAQRDVEKLAAQPSSKPWDASGAPREAAGRRDATWGQVLGVTAAGLATAGILVLVLGPPSAEHAAPAVSLGVLPGGVQAGCSTNF